MPLLPARTSSLAAYSGWAAVAAFLALGLPLALRMPLWCDANLYDVAGHEVRAGGVHYRDVFDTNLPGFVWLMAVMRAVAGSSSEAAQVTDLLVVAVGVFLVERLAARSGASPAGRAWLVAGAAAFYPFLSESCRLQRDVWMLPVVLVAVLLRLRRAGAAGAGRPVWWTGLVEGAVWGAAVWIKPHVVPVAVAAWLATAPRFAAGSWRRLVADLGAVTAGGALVGAAGVGWLIATGAWEPFVDVFTTWNTAYLKGVYWQLPRRLREELAVFPPWSLGALVAVPLAVWNVITGWGLARSDPARAATAPDRAMLAAVYLAWLAAALFLQKQFLYVHVPEIVLMFGVFAANRVPGPAVLVGWLIATTVVLLALGGGGPPEWHADAVRTRPVYRHVVAFHPAFDSARTRWWPDCFRAPVPELRTGVAFVPHSYPGTDWAELEPVAQYLEGRVGGRELIAWHDSPCALYRRLGVRPVFRFMHLTTVQEMGEPQYQRVKAELGSAARPGVFVVSDLRRVLSPGATPTFGPDGLPLELPSGQRSQFPFTQPVVYRSPGGRYLVHRIEHVPVGDCRLPRSPGTD